MEETLHQLIGYPVIYTVLAPSQVVVQDFWTINSIDMIVNFRYTIRTHSMYGIFAYIYHKNQPNVGKYTIHGSYGEGFNLYTSVRRCRHWFLPRKKHENWGLDAWLGVAIYNDLSRDHPKWWFSKGIPLKMALNQVRIYNKLP